MLFSGAICYPFAKTKVDVNKRDQARATWSFFMPTLLIVDDDRRVLDICSRTLLSQGYKVIAAQSAEEGLERFSPDVDLVLCDLRMPQKDGLWLLKTLREKDPEVRFVLMSGAARPEDIAELKKFPATHFAAKPAVLLDIADIVKKYFPNG